MSRTFVNICDNRNRLPSHVPRYKKSPHKMLKIWIRRIGEVVRQKVGTAKREAYARDVGISRQQLAIIENGKRDYGVEALFRVLAGPRPNDDPVASLLRSWPLANNLSSEDIDACYLMIAALSSKDQKREQALQLIQMLRTIMGEKTRVPFTGSAHSPPGKEPGTA